MYLLIIRQESKDKSVFEMHTFSQEITTYLKIVIDYEKCALIAQLDKH